MRNEINIKEDKAVQENNSFGGKKLKEKFLIS